MWGCHGSIGTTRAWGSECGRPTRFSAWLAQSRVRVVVSTWGDVRVAQLHQPDAGHGRRRDDDLFTDNEKA